MQTVAAGYEPIPLTFDEMHAQPGGVRPHWSSFLRSFEAMGAATLARRWAEVRRLMRENGVTFNVHGGPGGLERPWELDPLPLLLGESEWSSLSAGLVQRAQLLDMVLEDIYGSQDLLREGLLPPELVFAHPGFLRPCHGLPVASQSRLLLYSTDLVRTPEGQWMILRDRTQAPVGAGYALENRLVLSRLLPELFRECRSARLGPFFEGLRASLEGLAALNPNNPRIVLLTSGPESPVYFEHAYLAQYLGCALVEGDDLTVRDNAVYLKQLEGLQPVDVIWRRLDDAFCDPLELRGDSWWGVPGLVQAVRSGNVVVANSLGSGWLETPALGPFLPALCRHFLGQELEVPGVPSWWCGDPGACQHVLSHLDKLVVRTAFPQQTFLGGRRAVFGAELSRAEREDLGLRIRARPYAWVAQDQVSMSTSPVWSGQRLEPRHMVLRAFLSSREEGFEVLPGGLARVARTADSLVVTLSASGGSKDTWVISSEEPSSGSHPVVRPGAQVGLSRGGNDLPSRVADSLFWLGRYVERAEGMVRLIRGCLELLGDPEDAAAVPRLLDVMHPEEGEDWPRIRELALESKKFGLAFLLRQVHRLSTSVRDRVSVDCWRILTGLTIGPAEHERVLMDQLEELITELWAFCGMATESMSRGYGWRFLDLGRRLERAVRTVELVQGTLVEFRAQEDALLEAVLRICDSGRTYRRRYPAGLQMAPVLDLILCDESNPRSIAFQLVQVEEHLSHLPDQQALRSPEQRLALALLTDLRLLDVAHLAADPGRCKLFLESCQQRLPQLGDALSRHYLVHVAPARQRPPLPLEERHE